MVNFNPIDYVYVVRWQADLVNTNESVLCVCDKPYYTNNGIQQKWKRGDYKFANLYIASVKCVHIISFS